MIILIHSDIKIYTYMRKCAWVCTRMVNITTCMHRHYCAYKHYSCFATTRRNNTNTTVHFGTATVQNLQSLKTAQPCPRIRGYHRNFIQTQVPATNISSSNHTNVMHFTYMRSQHTHIIYIRAIMLYYVQQHTYSWIYNNSNNSFHCIAPFQARHSTHVHACTVNRVLILPF